MKGRAQFACFAVGLLAVLGLFASSAEASVSVSMDVSSIRTDPFASLPQLTSKPVAETLAAAHQADNPCIALCELAASIDADPFGYGVKPRPFGGRATPFGSQYFYAAANPTFYVDPTGHAYTQEQLREIAGRFKSTTDAAGRMGGRLALAGGTVVTGGVLATAGAVGIAGTTAIGAGGGFTVGYGNARIDGATHDQAVDAGNIGALQSSIAAAFGYLGGMAGSAWATAREWSGNAVGTIAATTSGFVGDLAAQGTMIASGLQERYDAGMGVFNAALGGVLGRRAATIEEPRDTLRSLQNSLRDDDAMRQVLTARAHAEALAEDIARATSADLVPTAPRSVAEVAAAPNLGGRHRDTRVGGTTYETESHHPIANAISPLATADAPAVRVGKFAEHPMTGSYKNSFKAQRFRYWQKKLVDAGELDKAFGLGVRDLRRVGRRLGNPEMFDRHIQEMLDSLPRRSDGGIDWTKIERK